MVAFIVSTVPPVVVSTATAAPIPSAVRIVRRGVRWTLRNGIRASTPPGAGTRRRGRADPPAAVRPERIASIGATRTARTIGSIAARNGTAKPRPAATA